MSKYYKAIVSPFFKYTTAFLPPAFVPSTPRRITALSAMIVIDIFTGVTPYKLLIAFLISDLFVFADTLNT